MVQGSVDEPRAPHWVNAANMGWGACRTQAGNYPWVEKPREDWSKDETQCLPKEAAVAHLHQFCPRRMQIYPCQCFSFQEKADTYRKYFDCKRWSTRTRDHTLLDMSRQKVPMGWTSLTATDGHLWEAKTTDPWQSFLQFHSICP